MDPFLESPDIWPDFHDALAGEIRRELNGILPPPYYARLEMRPEIGIVEEGLERRIVPDVAVVRRKPHGADDGGGVAVHAAPPASASKSYEVTVTSEPIRHHYLEIRDPSRGHKLVTLVEIVSPSNKRPGRDRRAYEKKQCEVLDSDASLVELDLLRAGERLLPHPEVERFVATLSPPVHYLVVVNRAWSRVGGREAWTVFPWTVREPLPRVPVPLRQDIEEPLLDLQAVFERAWESGPYQRGAVDYSQPPEPPLDGDDAAWIADLVRHAGIVRAP